jgi:hypothetical protein
LPQHLLTFKGKTLEVLILFELSPHLVGRQVAILAKPIAAMRPGTARPETLLPVETGRRTLRRGASAHRLRELQSPTRCRAKSHRQPGLGPSRYIRSGITSRCRGPVDRRRRWQRSGKGARQHQQHDGVRRDHFLGSFGFKRLCRRAADHRRLIGSASAVAVVQYVKRLEFL